MISRLSGSEMILVCPMIAASVIARAVMMASGLASIVCDDRTRVVVPVVVRGCNGCGHTIATLEQIT